MNVLDRPPDAVHTADATCVSHANASHVNVDAITLYDDERIVPRTGDNGRSPVTVVAVKKPVAPALR